MTYFTSRVAHYNYVFKMERYHIVVKQTQVLTLQLKMLPSHSYTPKVGCRHGNHPAIQPLMESLNNKKGRSCELKSHEEVKWTMQVIGHGLTLPLQDPTVIQLCSYRNLPELAKPTVLCQEVGTCSYLANTRSLRSTNLQTLLCFVYATRERATDFRSSDTV